MDASELRIGNLVDLYGSVATVERFDFNETPPKGLAVDKGNPIPLTEEWLIKLGFEKDNETRAWSILTALKRLDYLFELEEYYDHFKPTFLRIEIKYVHQLQNLYFALTGQELKQI